MERDEISELVANNIKALMEAKGLDAAKLARASKINATGVYDILKGKSRSPKIETIAKIADGLNVPLSAIFEDSASTALRRELLYIFENLPEPQRQLFLQTGMAWLQDKKQA